MSFATFERRWRSAVWPVLILLSAAFLRLYRLTSVPFGWHPDEATKALLARDVLDGKYFPVFFSAFTGREALYVYLEAGAFALLGEHIFVARLLSAFSGVLTVALTYAVARRVFSRQEALFAAAFLALSLWHLIASRNGYRAVIQPLVQLPVLLLFFRGWQSERGHGLRHFALGGIWLGLTQYTYTAARFFPLFVVGLVVLAAVFITERARAHWRGIILAALLSAVVFLPLGIHFLQNPLDFYGRAAQISIFSPEWSGGNSWLRLWQSAKETARMFTVWGDINYRFNIAGRPVFGTIAGALFYLGLALSLWRTVVRRGFERFVYAACLLWLVIMLAPMILSAESLPYYQRAIGVLPVVYFFPAIGLAFLVHSVRHVASSRTRSQTSDNRFAALLLLPILGFFIWSGAQVYTAYFDEWHGSTQNDDDRRVAMVYVADYLNELGQTPQNLYVSTQYVQHPTLALLSPQLYDSVSWFDATQSLPLAPADEEATYIFLLENAPQPQLLQKAPNLNRLQRVEDRFGRPVFEVYERPAAPWPEPEVVDTAAWSWATTFEESNSAMRNVIELPAPFGDVLALEGHNRYSTAATPGATLELVTYWNLLRRPGRQYTFFAHLLNASGEVVAGYDANFYPTTFWPEDGGEMLLSYFPLVVPQDAAPGEYQLEIGVYHQPSGERLPVIGQGEAVADRLLLAPVQVHP
jgi:4-amino-4-deoxy-L-arabinose transferase-like glycosyltransferase